MIDYTLIGKRIQTQRLEKGITQEKLAEQVGISLQNREWAGLSNPGNPL